MPKSPEFGLSENEPKEPGEPKEDFEAELDVRLKERLEILKRQADEINEEYARLQEISKTRRLTEEEMKHFKKLSGLE